jgi:hypothetical protein
MEKVDRPGDVDVFRWSDSLHTVKPALTVTCLEAPSVSVKAPFLTDLLPPKLAVITVVCFGCCEKEFRCWG